MELDPRLFWWALDLCCRSSLKNRVGKQYVYVWVLPQWRFIPDPPLTWMNARRSGQIPHRANKERLGPLARTLYLNWGELLANDCVLFTFSCSELFWTFMPLHCVCPQMVSWKYQVLYLNGKYNICHVRLKTQRTQWNLTKEYKEWKKGLGDWNLWHVRTW